MKRTSKYPDPTPYELVLCARTYPEEHRHYRLREGEAFVWLPEDDAVARLNHYAPCQPFAPIVPHADAEGA